MVKLISIAAAAALSLAVTSCAKNDTGPTYPVVGTVDQTKMEQAAYAARASYAGLNHLFAEYVDLPRCIAGPTRACSDQAIVNRIRPIELAADKATKGASDIARSPTKTPVALANAVADAQRAVQVFRDTVAVVKPQAKEIQ